MRAVVVDPSSEGRLILKEVPPPVALPSEAVVRVAALSLNRGEVRRAMAAEAGWRPGWDLAGTVAVAAANGAGPAAGTRVVGLLGAGAWAETVAVPANALAVLPEGVSFAQASTLPVAGLTALYALAKGGYLLARPVLITGASGGVGHFAVQLARQAGAHVVGLVHQERHAAFVAAAGAHAVVVTADGKEAAAHGPYHLILDSVGGATLGSVLAQLDERGTCVSFGVSAGPEATFDVRRFFGTGGCTLYGFILFHEIEAAPAANGLARLAQMVADGRLTPHIDVEAPWSDVAQVAQSLLERRYPGKAVLHLDSSSAIL